jgi:hypothetical protein
MNKETANNNKFKIIVAQLQKFFSDKHDIQLFEKSEGGTCWTAWIP